eukprot:gnl/MRDRNA2_/MRDRNA2_96550_c0_seq1.p1 gnl/MRDRNA2_/MRDRNA2_96550_c0~~gnl/MRDRNA2_/MRDRNA2_96550_c0_seq1.p1  ORF type:complete len:194 (+),score=24.52 gnl/MRDRNA2_/MRDRNA2_96550_c0_seq1:70-582(+)
MALAVSRVSAPARQRKTPSKTCETSECSAVGSRLAWPRTTDSQAPSRLLRASSASQIAASHLSRASDTHLSRSQSSAGSQISSFVGSTQSQVYPWEMAGLYTHKIDHLETLFKPPGVKRDMTSTSQWIHRVSPDFARESRLVSSTGLAHKRDYFTEFHEEKVMKGGIMRP